MIKFIRYLRYWLEIYDHYGLNGILSHFILCHFQQDNLIHRNNGYDIISLKDNTNSYYTGKFQNNPYWK
jgi:hypothetical protein